MANAYLASCFLCKGTALKSYVGMGVLMDCKECGLLYKVSHGALRSFFDRDDEKECLDAEDKARLLQHLKDQWSELPGEVQVITTEVVGKVTGKLPQAR